MLTQYEAPELDPAIDEALIAYKSKRMEELPDSEF
jgi:trimethylamine:corrinoid methyltransferase-like protein